MKIETVGTLRPTRTRLARLSDSAPTITQEVFLTRSDARKVRDFLNHFIEWSAQEER